LDKVNRLEEFFAGYKAMEIDAGLMRAYVLDQQAKGLSNGSINRSLSALRRMFNIQREDGTLQNIPHFPMVKEAAPRQGFFERADYDKLFAVLPDHLRVPFAIGYFSGMRAGEILGLEWDQVDFLRNIIRLRAGETKNDDSREVPLIPELRGLLVARRADPKREGCKYVCYKLDKLGHAVRLKGFRKAWISRCVKAGLGTLTPALDENGKQLFHPKRSENATPKPIMIYEGRYFHDLRRSGARALLHTGVPERIIMRIGGWKTRSVFDRYTITTQADVIEAGKKLTAYHSAEFGHNSGTIAVQVEESEEVRH
jgi:integrase